MRASEADCIDATVDLAYLKEHGGPGTEKDEAEAERLYEKVNGAKGWRAQRHQQDIVRRALKPCWSCM